MGVAVPTSANVLVAPPAEATIKVGPDLKKACNIGDINAAPKFAFDRSDLSADDRNVLEEVARCLTTGPMMGRPLSLIGRADPRGEAEYNMNLGEQRAMSAKDYLGHLGVTADRVRETSRGALDATGTDEATWRTDRRVDLELAEGAGAGR